MRSSSILAAEVELNDLEHVDWKLCWISSGAAGAAESDRRKLTACWFSPGSTDVRCATGSSFGGSRIFPPQVPDSCDGQQLRRVPQSPGALRRGAVAACPGARGCPRQRSATEVERSAGDPAGEVRHWSWRWWWWAARCWSWRSWAARRWTRSLLGIAGEVLSRSLLELDGARAHGALTVALPGGSRPTRCLRDRSSRSVGLREDLARDCGIDRGRRGRMEVGDRGFEMI